MLMVTEEKLRNLVSSKFKYGIPRWALEEIVAEIVEECKKVDSNQKEAAK